MTTANRPILNLDLDLLRTFVAVADLNTFAAAAVAVAVLNQPSVNKCSD